MRRLSDLTAPFHSRVTWKGGGGGSSTSTTTSGIDPEFKPYLVEGLRDANQMRKQEAAYGGKAAMDAANRQAAEARRIMDRGSMADQAYTRALKTAQGQMPGQLSSARAQAMANAAGQNAMFDRIAQEDASRLAAGRELTGAAQAYEDAPHRSLQRYFGYLQGAPKQNTTTQTGGGGGK